MTRGHNVKTTPRQTSRKPAPSAPPPPTMTPLPLPQARRLPLERQQDLLDAATHLVAEKGLGATTVLDITQTAGVAKGTFYLYFDSRDDLLATLKQRFFEGLVAELSSLLAAPDPEDWWSLADESVERAIHYMLERREMIEILAREDPAPSSSSPVIEAYRTVFNPIRAFIEVGINAGTFRASDPAMMGALLFHAVRETVTQAVLYFEPVDERRLVAAAQELVRKALGP
jgi:AcrR family transcriptional regulator